MKKRIVSIELLRILAMMMVVMLHYLSKGGLLTSLTEEFSGGLYRMASGGVFHRGCECIYADQRLFSGGIGF